MLTSSPNLLDRQKKQHEQLANQILGKNRKDRRASAPGPGAGQKMQSVKPGSLASRIGVPKVLLPSLPPAALSKMIPHLDHLRIPYSALPQPPSARPRNRIPFPRQSRPADRAENLHTRVAPMPNDS